MYLSLETLINVHHKHKLIYYGGTDRPGEFCYNFSISSDPTQMAHFPTRISEYGSHSTALLSDSNICSTVPFCPPNADHVADSVSISLPFNL